MSQVHKLIMKTRSNKRDTRKVAERCAVSGLNHADKHLAEYAHGWRPEERTSDLSSDMDLDSVTDLLKSIVSNAKPTPELQTQLGLAEAATGKPFVLVRKHLLDTLELLATSLHRELVKKKLILLESDILPNRFGAAPNPAPKATPRATPRAARATPKEPHIDRDDICIPVGNTSKQMNANGPSVCKPSQPRPGQARVVEPSVPSVSKPGQARPGMQATPAIDTCDSAEHMRRLKVAERIDCLDNENRWGKGIVVEVMEDGIIIHWEGFKKTLDEKITFNEHFRCTKAGVHVKRTATPAQANKSKSQPKPHTKRARPVVEVVEEPDLPASKVARSDAEPLDNGDGGGGRSRRNCKSIFKRN